MKGENKENSSKEGKSKEPEGRVIKRKTRVRPMNVRKAEIAEGGLKEGCCCREADAMVDFSVALLSPMGIIVRGGMLSGLTALPRYSTPLVWRGDDQGDSDDGWEGVRFSLRERGAIALMTRGNVVRITVECRRTGGKHVTPAHPKIGCKFECKRL